MRSTNERSRMKCWLKAGITARSRSTARSGSTARSRRKAAIGISAAMLALALDAGPALASEFVPSLNPDTSCEINIVGNYANFEALEAEADRFREYYPDVDIIYTKMDDYNNIISTALEGGDAPDIYVVYHWMVGRDQYAGVFEHAQNLVDEEAGVDVSCIREGLLNTDENGQVLMVPVFSTTYGMLVNVDLFEKEGLEVPETYQELLETCEKLKQAGYAGPLLGYAGERSSLYTATFPLFYAGVRDNPQLVAPLNALDKSAAEAMRTALEQSQALAQSGCLDLEASAALEDDYNAVIMRFFEGDVPMMIGSGDTVSGTLKRESQSEAFSASPFRYEFAPFPAAEEGAYFLDLPSIEFAVNKDSANLEMADEFMRFLITPEELMNMSEVKRLVSPATNLSFEGIYAPFGEVPQERVVETQTIGLLDDPTVQFRVAANAVIEGSMTVDEAIAAFGTLGK